MKTASTMKPSPDTLPDESGLSLTSPKSVTGQFRQILLSLRVRQWTKNILLFAALIFANQADQISLIIRCITGFVLFSFCAGSIYIFNDIRDREQDRCHPVKKNRPIASGALPLATAWGAFLILAALSLGLSFLFSAPFGFCLLAYFALQILYSGFLKHIVIIDVFAVSFSYLIRVVAGALLVGVVISNWILICTILLALFLALSKRRHELVLLESSANQHRVILDEYSPQLLDQMISVVTAATLIAYTIYVLDYQTSGSFNGMILTIPFVLYGIFRYLYLVHMKKSGGQPEEILLTDLPLLADVILYGMVVVLIMYF